MQKKSPSETGIQCQRFFKGYALQFNAAQFIILALCCGGANRLAV